MTSFIGNMVESSLFGIMRAYNEWLGPEHHVTRGPIHLGTDKLLTFHIDHTDKNYINWMVWTIHGFEAPDHTETYIKVRVEVSGTDVFRVEFEASGEYTVDDALLFSNYVMKDLHTELSAYTKREGWDAENINLY